jgi:hypothetical protein
MLELGPLAFASPWLLAGLATLPVLWWLLRVLPPAPRRLDFPAIRLLLMLRRREETPAHTPLWLILLRMALATLVILAVAHPLLNPGTEFAGSGPVVIVVDDGWGAARGWSEREGAMMSLIDRAERASKPVVLLTTAKPPGDEPLAASGVLRAADARRLARAIKPRPWPVDRAAALKAIEAQKIDGAATVVWLSDGLAGADGRNAVALAERLQRIGSLEVYVEERGKLARLVAEPQAQGTDLVVPVRRATAVGASEFAVRAVGDNGKLLARQEARFAEGAIAAEARLSLPGEIRNDIARVEIEGEASAGASFLIDERWRRRPVGLFSGETSERAQPLLSDLYYLDRALNPISEVRRGTVDELLGRTLAVMILADVGKLTDSQVERLEEWVERGGVALRFAGPRLATDQSDKLIPVRLRSGGRELGGVMSWEQPAALLPFEDSSPFAGLAVPPDVRIERQVLAEPSLDLDRKTWARLTDGTPLVTAEKKGKGYVVLVHTTANAEWSNLPLSGLFVQMLQRLVGLSQGIAGENEQGVLAPIETMDGFGRLESPPSTAIPIEAAKFADAMPGPRTPPGFYGREGGRRALNLATAVAELKPLPDLPGGVSSRSYPAAGELDLKPALLLAALLIALADLLISFVLRGFMPGRIVRAGTAALALGAVLVGGNPASAQATRNSEIDFAVQATRETRLAYVETGTPAIDRISRDGLRGLGEMLKRRTAIEPLDPMAVNVEKDELAFFPLLYWPIAATQPRISDTALAKLQSFLRTGGTILFDTREQGDLTLNPTGGGGAASGRLRSILQALDIPALIPVPQDHVLTKAFYLLGQFPGRFTGGQVWVEARGGRHNDGVSSVIIGSNDWAGAWAIERDGAPSMPVVPGGERQREMAYRFGINWVMYALTGNYKTDQVHVPAIMERLGQ